MGRQICDVGGGFKDFKQERGWRSCGGEREGVGTWQLR